MKTKYEFLKKMFVVYGLLPINSNTNKEFDPLRMHNVIAILNFYGYLSHFIKQYCRNF